jgi:hypothetical protein
MTKRKPATAIRTTQVSGDGKLRRVLDAACAESGYALDELTVLSLHTDPYRLDTPAGHRDGKWAAQQLARAYGSDRQTHWRGLHYAMVVKGNIKKPNGKTYRNTHDDWSWLSEYAVKAARWLGYISFDRIKDRRNPDPIIHRKLRPPRTTLVDAELTNIDIEAIEPTPLTVAFAPRQAFQFVIFGEKSSLEEVALPLAEKYEADLYLASGEISDTLIYRMAKDAAADGRPLIVFTIADCDPAGWQMSVSIARKLQAFRDLFFPHLRFEVVPAALTIKQVKRLRLPDTPLKDTERRAAKWKEVFGVEQTEVDALLTPAALERNTLRDLVDAAIADYHDDTLAGRVNDAEDEWTDAAQVAIDRHVNARRFAQIRRDTRAVSDEIARINEQLRDLVDGVTLPPVEVPQAQAPEPTRHALVNRADDWVTATRALIAHKSYRKRAKN